MNVPANINLMQFTSAGPTSSVKRRKMTNQVIEPILRIPVPEIPLQRKEGNFLYLVTWAQK